ncbi:uncharacterized protein LOC106153510 [Lingula anatina]|uniref:Uncharacterized protein LOC106153510 n=1 Tax=Lingula anatina TaxID=7574 RepID=A0A1S3HBM9_LINAN|nr:uncharacterized protein LOC106153510 [Lingula anatina]|eukprot:XP_013382931.1 uncharacterized protein LOC106153510 [Lingula anatina]
MAYIYVRFPFLLCRQVIYLYTLIGGWFPQLLASVVTTLNTPGNGTDSTTTDSDASLLNTVTRLSSTKSTDSISSNSVSLDNGAQMKENGPWFLNPTQITLIAIGVTFFIVILVVMGSLFTHWQRRRNAHRIRHCDQPKVFAPRKRRHQRPSPPGPPRRARPASTASAAASTASAS